MIIISTNCSNIAFNRLIRLLIFGSSCSPVLVSPPPEPDPLEPYFPLGYVGI